MIGAAIWVWPAVFSMVSYAGQQRLHGEPPPSWRELLFSGGDWLLYAAVTPVIFWASGRWPVVRPHVTRRTAVHLGFALLFCVVWATGGKLLDLVLVSVFEPDRLLAAISAAGDELGRRVAVNVTSWILTTIPFGVVVYVTVTGLAHALRYFAEARDRDVQMARLSEQLTAARLSALEARLNPHFLFNTLNTIAVRARDRDTSGTVRMVEQLSDLLRRTLSRPGTNEVQLADEIDLVREYLAIEQARFSDRLRPEFQIAEGLGSAAVPGFALQHLVENAIRHGIAKRTESGRVVVAARRDGDTLELLVTDDGPGLAPGREAVAGHGLENTRERLRALYGERAALTLTPLVPTGTRATLRVPFHEVVPEGDVAPA